MIWPDLKYCEIKDYGRYICIYRYIKYQLNLYYASVYMHSEQKVKDLINKETAPISEQQWSGWRTKDANYRNQKRELTSQYASKFQYMFSAQRLNSLQMNRFLTQSVISVHSQPQSHETSRWTRVCRDVVQVLGRQTAKLLISRTVICICLFNV